jgi:hypothetical protein
MGSSPFPDDLKAARLHVEAGSPLAEIFLIDHQFTLRERSIGDLDVEVEPGVYNLKARLGDTTVEQLVVLNGDQDVDLGAALSPVSPAPLEGVSPEAAVRVAAEASTTVAKRTGRGAKIFLLTRSQGGGAPLVELSLHRPDGTQIEDLTDEGAAAAGGTVAVDPGTYFLRWEDISGIEAEQALVAVRGWQTQVFMLDEAETSPEYGRHNVSVHMAKQAFDPKSEICRRTEEARAALADERKVASETIGELFAKCMNPMLCLFGAHLMLLARQAVESSSDEDSARVKAPVGFDQEVFDRVVGNLGDLLGPHNPDVVALSAKLSEPPSQLPALDAPPMLWRSWTLLLDASNDSPDLLPLGVCRQVAKLMPVRPFLVWSPVDEQAADEWQGDLKRVVQSSTASADGDTRRQLTQQLFVPRAAIDKVVDDSGP